MRRSTALPVRCPLQARTSSTALAVVLTACTALAGEPAVPPTSGMGPIEREVHRRVYEGKGGNRELHALQKMSLEELVEKTSFAKWEIDPAEFSRNLERKKRELAAMREGSFRRLMRPPDQARIARATKTRRDHKALASLGKSEAWLDLLDLWQVGLLNPQRSADHGHVAQFLEDVHGVLTGALRGELKRPRFPHSCFGKARSAAHMFLTAEAYVRAHPDFQKKEPVAFRQLRTAMDLLKEVTYQAWTFPHSANKDMRRKKPMQTATFRYHGGYTVGNFTGYRPLVECAMVFNDTRMLDVVKDVTEKALSSKSGCFDVYESFWPDGINTEGTMFAHGNQNYTFGYGKDYVMGMLKLATSLRGTVWEIDPRKWDGVVDMLLDGWQWYLHRGEREISIMGRHSLYAPSSPRASGKAHGNGYILWGWHSDIVELSGGRIARKAEFDRMYLRMKANEDLVGNRYFWLSEDLLHHRKDQYVCVNMSSVRVKGPEGTSDTSLHNRMFGCGMTVLKRAPGDLDRIRGAWDYTALPGITFAQGDSCTYSRSWESCFGDNIYSGGVSDGMNGLCAFKYRQKGISIAINKAYFAFDNRLVCLGSSLLNPKKAQAWTTVSQCTATTAVRLFVNGAGKTFPHGTPVNLRERSDRPIRVWHDKMGYVVFPHNGRAEIALKVERRMTHWRHIGKWWNRNAKEYPLEVFQLSIPHDPAATEPNQGYRYAVLFNVDPGELARRLNAGDIEILQNDDRVQAVKCGPHTGLVFLEEGAFRSERLSMSVDRPAILMLDETEPGAVKLTYADPLLDPAARELIVRTNLRLAGPTARGGVLRLPLPRIPEVGKPARTTLDRSF